MKMVREEKTEKTTDKPLSDSDNAKENDDAKAKKAEVTPDANITKNKSPKDKDKTSSKDKSGSKGGTSQAEVDKIKDKPEAKTDQKNNNMPSKSNDKSDEAKKTERSGDRRASTSKPPPPSEQKARKPSIAINSADADTDDLVRTAVQKARRASIRAKSRPSLGPQSLLPQTASRLVSAADVTAALEADNVWDLAVKMKRVTAELADPDRGQRQTTLIVLGGKQTGKTTLIGQLLDSEEPARRTLGLDYMYARCAGSGIDRDVCQIWELGGGTAFLQLLDTPVRAERLSDTACVIAVDLTRPDTILPTVETITKYLTELIDRKLKEAGTTGVLVRNLLTSQLNSRRPEGHPDTNTVQPLLIPLALVGGMYDKFQPMDAADKKIVCEAMRWAAHKHFATLLYFSSKEGALQRRAKDLLTYLAFGEEPNPRQSLDVQKPLQIAAGQDSFRAIGGGGDGSLPYDVVLSRVSARWPPTAEATGVPDDPARDALFAEPEIDALRAEKAKELDRLRQDLERRRKMALERDAAERLQSGRTPEAVSRQEAQQAAAQLLERHHGRVGDKTADVRKAGASKADMRKADVTKADASKADATKADVTKANAKAESKAVAKSDGKDGAKTDTQAAAKSTVKTDGKLPAKAETKANTKPAAESDEQKDTRVDVKADKKPADKPHAKADVKPVAKK